MYRMIFLCSVLIFSCSDADSEFKEFAFGEVKDTELEAICMYLDTVDGKSDSIGYESGNAGVIIIRNRKGEPGGFQFDPPPKLAEVMESRKVRFILRLKSQECVLVNFRKYDSPGVNRYLVYHAVPLDSCEYFKNKINLESDPEADYGYINLDSNWTISIEEIPGPFDKLQE